MNIDMYDSIYTENNPITDKEIVSIEKHFIIVKDDEFYGIMLLNAKNMQGHILEERYHFITKAINNLYIVFSHNGYAIMDEHCQIITPYYDHISADGDVFVAKEGDRWKLLDQSGKVISNTYNDIHHFQGKYALVKQSSFKGYIDRQGNEIVQPIYYSIDILSDEFYAASTRYFSCKNVYQMKTGKQILNYGESWRYSVTDIELIDNKYFIFMLDNKRYGLYDTSGKLLLKPKYYNIVYIGENRFALETRNKIKIVDNSFQVITKINKPIGDVEIKYLKENRFIVNGNLYDTSGKFITHCNYEKIYPFENGYAIIRYDFDDYIIDLEGEEVLSSPYDNISNIDKGIFLIRKRFDYKFFNANSQFHSSYYDNIEPLNAHFLVSSCDYKTPTFNILDYEGHALFENDLSCIKDDYQNNIVRCLDENKWYLYNYQTRKIVSEYYDRIYPVDIGYKVQNLGLFGFVDKQGQEIIKPLYDDFTIIQENDFYILKHEKTGFNIYSLLDSNGHELFKHKRLNSIHVLNDKQLLINNCLIDINKLANGYNILIDVNDNQKELSFKTKEEQLKHYYALTGVFNQKISDWMKKREKRIEKFNQENKAEMKDLKNILGSKTEIVQNLISSIEDNDQKAYQLLKENKFY